MSYIVLMQDSQLQAYLLESNVHSIFHFLKLHFFRKKVCTRPYDKGDKPGGAEGKHGAENYSAERFQNDTRRGGGKQVYKQTFRVPQSVKNMAAERVIEIEKCLTGDNETDVCILLKMLNDRIK